MRFQFNGNATDLETLKNALNSDPQTRAQFEANPAVFLGEHGIEIDQETATALTSNINGNKPKAAAAIFIPHADVHVDIG